MRTTPSHRNAFATELSGELAIDVKAVSSNETAVRGADVLITATSSRVPVFDPEWLEPGVHINALGPKFRTAQEISPAVSAVSDVIATDSRAQIENHENEFFLADTPHQSRVVELGEFLHGSARGRDAPEDITLFCSVGLAGTEVVLAHEAFRRYRNET